LVPIEEEAHIGWLEAWLDQNNQMGLENCLTNQTQGAAG